MDFITACMSVHKIIIRSLFFTLYIHVFAIMRFNDAALSRLVVSRFLEQKWCMYAGSVNNYWSIDHHWSTPLECTTGVHRRSVEYQWTLILNQYGFNCNFLLHGTSLDYALAYIQALYFSYALEVRYLPPNLVICRSSGARNFAKCLIIWRRFHP